MHRRQRATHLQSDQRRLRGAERSTLAQQLFERPAVNELRPDSDASFDAIGAVDGHDVRMAHLREYPAFVDDLRRVERFRTVPGKQLQRHLAVEPAVPGAIHLAVRTLANPVEQAEMPPGFVLAFRTISAGRVIGPRRNRSMNGGDRRVTFSSSTARCRDVGGVRLRCPPVDRHTIDQCTRNLVQHVVDRLHAFIAPICLASRTMARSVAMRAAFGLGLSNSSAISRFV